MFTVMNKTKPDQKYSYDFYIIHYYKHQLVEVNPLQSPKGMNFQMGSILMKNKLLTLTMSGGNQSKVSFCPREC